MKATTTTKNCSSLVSDFLKKEYMKALDSIIADISENTIKSIETFISLPEEEKYQGMPESIIPQSESDIQTGFEHFKNHYPHLSIDDTVLIIPYGSPEIICERKRRSEQNISRRNSSPYKANPFLASSLLLTLNTSKNSKMSYTLARNLPRNFGQKKILEIKSSSSSWTRTTES